MSVKDDGAVTKATARNYLVHWATVYIEQLQSGGELSFGLARRINKAASLLGCAEPFPEPCQGTGENARSVYAGYHDAVGEMSAFFRIVDPFGAPCPLCPEHRRNIIATLQNLIAESAILPSRLHIEDLPETVRAVAAHIDKHPEGLQASQIAEAIGITENHFTKNIFPQLLPFGYRTPGRGSREGYKPPKC